MVKISGIPVSSTEQSLRQLFGQFGVVVGFKYFVYVTNLFSNYENLSIYRNDKKMALIQMSNVAEAIEALIALHDNKLDENQPNTIKVSFAKSTIV